MADANTTEEKVPLQPGEYFDERAGRHLEPGDPEYDHVAYRAAAKLEPLSAEVAEFAYWFGKPVAVQLTVPLIGVDFGGATLVGRGGTYGAPQVTQMEGQPALTQVVAGSLRPAECGNRLLLQSRSQSGALVEVGLPVAAVGYISLVLEAPKQSRIVRPNAN